MKNQDEIILKDIVSEFAHVLFDKNTKHRKIPNDLIAKVLELKKVGVSINEISKSFKVTSRTLHNWIRKNRINQSIVPKRLHLKQAENSELIKTTKIESNNITLARLIFKSGIHLELPFDKITFEFLSNLNEIGN